LVLDRGSLLMLNKNMKRIYDLLLEEHLKSQRPAKVV
jgi:hypothetical protein